MGEILIGTASWTDKTLLASGWYPPGADSAEERLRFYAERFPLVEVDSTYYFPPSEKNSELWAERTPKDFTFNVKAFSLLTQHPTKVKAIYEDLRPETDKKNVYIGDLEGMTRRPARWYDNTFARAGMRRVAPYCWLAKELAEEASLLEL